MTALQPFGPQQLTNTIKGKPDLGSARPLFGEAIMIGRFFCRLRAWLGIGLLAVLTVFHLSSQASAGDAATLNVLGFSSDGSIFAFEEFGVQDGSGFPYANRFYINTETDTFVSGSPVRKRIDNESASVAEARALARAEGETIISDALLAANRGYLAASNPITELSADPFRVVVNPRPVNPPIDDPVEFRLTELPFVAEGTCTSITDTVQGFRLVEIKSEPGSITRLLSEDESVPGSRGCPLGYSIGGVQTFFPNAADPVVAVLIAIRTFGFEGPDFRWLAVTAKLSP